MEIRRFENIVAIKTEAGRLLGFHSRNMQVAELTEDVWKQLRASADRVSSAETSADVERIDRSASDEIVIWNQEVDPAAVDADIKQEVRSLLVNIAQVCNLKCSYCAAGGDGTYGDPLQHVEIETIYEQIRMLLHDLNDGSFTLTFFGGEPLIAPDTIRSLARFVKLQTAGRGIEPRFSIVTNGTLITDDIAELLASLKTHVTVSIDGPLAVNDRNRPTKSGRGSTAKTLAGLARLMKVRERLGSLTVGAVFGKHHTGVLTTYQFLQPLGFDSIKFDFAAEDGDALASQTYIEELAKTVDYAYALGGESELRRLQIFDAYFRSLDQQRRVNNHCGAGKSHMTVDGRGRLSACQWFVGRPTDELGHGTTLNHERIAHYAPRLNELNNCQSCWARHLCGGGCMYVNEVKTGSKHKKDDAFCMRSRSQIAKAIEYYARARYQPLDHLDQYQFNLQVSKKES